MDSRPSAPPVGAPRPTTKALALQAIAGLPDDANFEEVIERLHVVCEVERGLDEPDTGGFVLRDEAQRQMARWLG